MTIAPTSVGDPAVPLKLDFGCGPHKRADFKGVDIRPFDGVDIVTDLRQPWPWADNSVAEAHASHFIEHLNGPERIHFVNELYRVLEDGAKCTIIVPSWTSGRAYGDLTHQWPPVAEFWFYYLKKEWRDANAPHNEDYKCDFDATWGYSIHPQVQVRNQDFQTFALTFFKEAAQDIMATLVARKKGPKGA